MFANRQQKSAPPKGTRDERGMPPDIRARRKKRIAVFTAGPRTGQGAESQEKPRLTGGPSHCMICKAEGNSRKTAHERVYSTHHADTMNTGTAPGTENKHPFGRKPLPDIPPPAYGP